MSEGNRHVCAPPEPIAVCVKVIIGVMPIGQLIIGAVYQHDCPKQPYIPIYLIVMGVVTLLLSVLFVLPCTTSFGSHSMVWSVLVCLFFFCWFITGNVWIYSIYEPNYDKTLSSPDSYCNKALYLFAFWTTNLYYILFGLVLVSICCTHVLCSDY